MTFICTFTTGRSGTAWLTQLFSGVKWQKREIITNNNNAITHENWKISIIPDIKKLGMCHPKSIQLQLDCINKNLRDESFDNYMTTAHVIGRYFGYSLSHIKDYKIIYLERNEDDVVKSFITRLNKKKESNDYIKFVNDMWSKLLYHPSDKDTIITVSLEEWETYSVKQKIEWYWHETRRQWLKLKGFLDPNRFIEITYENMIQNKFDKLSDFIGIPINTEYVNVRVNK